MMFLHFNPDCERNIINDMVGFNDLFASDVFASDIITDTVVICVERRLDICWTRRSLAEHTASSQHGHEGIGRCVNGGNLKLGTPLSYLFQSDSKEVGAALLLCSSF